MQARTHHARWALPMLFVLAVGTAAATPSNKWRIQISSDADSDGVVVFHVAPTSEPAVDVSVPIGKDTGENGIARRIRDALKAKLGKDYKVETDDGEDVLLKKRHGEPNFELTVKSNTVNGVRIVLDKE